MSNFASVASHAGLSHGDIVLALLHEALHRTEREVPLPVLAAADLSGERPHAGAKPGGGPVGAAFREHDVPMCRQRIDAAEWDAHGGADLGPAAVWSDRACGVAALRMILLACRQPAPPLTELVKAGVASGAYAGKLGWLHAALADMATSLGVPAQAEAVEYVDLPVRLDQALLVASVTAELPADGRRGGHLIVLRGYELGRDDPLILFRDPSRWGQSHDRVRLSRLAGSYSGRCITVKSPAPPVTAEAAS